MMHTQLTTTHHPDFIDHFPLLTRGHGFTLRPGKQKPCVESGCALNKKGKGGEVHEAGRAKNACDWMETSQYNGPFPGVTPERRKKKEAKDDLEEAVAAGVAAGSSRCHDRCQIRRRYLHSVCLLPSELKAPVLAQMLLKVEALNETEQGMRRLAEYAGVELAARPVKKEKVA